MYKKNINIDLDLPSLLKLGHRSNSCIEQNFFFKFVPTLKPKKFFETPSPMCLSPLINHSDIDLFNLNEEERKCNSDDYDEIKGMKKNVGTNFYNIIKKSTKKVDAAKKRKSISNSNLFQVNAHKILFQTLKVKEQEKISVTIQITKEQEDEQDVMEKTSIKQRSLFVNKKSEDFGLSDSDDKDKGDKQAKTNKTIPKKRSILMHMEKRNRTFSNTSKEDLVTV